MKLCMLVKFHSGKLEIYFIFKKNNHWTSIQDGVGRHFECRFLSNNLGVDRNFSTEFGTVINNQQPNKAYRSIMMFLKIQHVHHLIAVVN